MPEETAINYEHYTSLTCQLMKNMGKKIRGKTSKMDYALITTPWLRTGVELNWLTLVTEASNNFPDPLKVLTRTPATYTGPN